MNNPPSPRKTIRIKVCGITRLDDALAAAHAGADALGFVFYKKSGRSIPPEDARIIIEQLPPFIDTVGVFVDSKRSEVEEIIRYCNLQYAQLHGEESVKYCERLARDAAPCRVIKAFRVRPELRPEHLAAYAPFVQSFLLDAYVKGEPGGTGTSFDWRVIERLALDRPCMLAGGLNAESVAAAVAMTCPAAVDVSSGVEKKPGRKDHDLIRAFIATVRSL